MCFPLDRDMDRTPYDDDPDDEVDEDIHAEPDPDWCDACGGLAVPMGILGNLQHFRCRNCGSVVSREVS
jgi:hypothetical protein